MKIVLAFSVATFVLSACVQTHPDMDCLFKDGVPKPGYSEGSCVPVDEATYGAG